MPSRPTVSRRAFLSTAAGCFGGSLLLDAGAFDAVSAAPDGPTWQQRWGDGTQRKFTPASLDPEALTASWSVTFAEHRGNATIECVDAAHVYVRDYDRLVAYSREDGSRAWTYAAEEGSFAQPTMAGDTILVQENDTVHAIATESGRARWTGSFDAPYRPSANPMVIDDTAYLPAGNSYVTIHPTTGLRRTSIDAAPLGTLLAATDEQLFWWTEGTLQATDHDRDSEWRRTFARAFPPSSKTIAVVEDRLVLRRRSTSGETLVTALDRTSGQQVWRAGDEVADTVAVTGDQGTVYIGAGTRLHALDATTGTEQWRVSTETVQPAPVVTPKTVYVPLGDGIAPVDPDSGAQQASTLLDGEPTTSLAAVGGGLYASTTTGIHALEER